MAFETNLENLRKSWEGGRKSSENHQKRRHQFIYTIKKTLKSFLEGQVFKFTSKETSFILVYDHLISLFLQCL